MAQGNRGVCGILPAGRLALFDACDKSLDRPSRSWVLAQKRGSNRRLRTFVVRVLFGAVDLRLPAAGLPQLALFVRLPHIPRPRGTVPHAVGRNWVCFAQSVPCEGAARGKLALFRTHVQTTITLFLPSSWLFRPSDGIGFVWRHGPRDGWQRRGLRPVRGAQGRLLAMVFSAPRGQIGFVCTTGPAAPVPRPGPLPPANWVCFAFFTPRRAGLP
jgi:hypothetical protein